jgi:hypothetical protein
MISCTECSVRAYRLDFSLLIKDITFCPWCNGKGLPCPEAGPWDDQNTYLCEDCCNIWFINNKVDYLLVSHIRLDKMEW